MNELGILGLMIVAYAVVVVTGISVHKDYLDNVIPTKEQVEYCNKNKSDNEVCQAFVFAVKGD